MMKNELGIGEAAKPLFAPANNGAKAEPRKARGNANKVSTLNLFAFSNFQKSKMNLLVRTCVYLCAAVTLGLLVFMLAYILVKGAVFLRPSVFWDSLLHFCFIL